MRTPRTTATTALVTALTACITAASACSSFHADDSAADPADGATEAGSATADGGDAPAAADGSSTADVAVVGDDFCTPHRKDPGFVYCNDFELPTASSSPFGFAQPSITPTVTSVQVIKDGSRHAVLQVKVDANAAGSHEVTLAQLVGATAADPLPLVVDLDIKIVTDDAPSITAAAIHAAGAGCEASFGLGVFDGMTVGGTRNRDVPLQPYAAGTWQHLTISLRKDNTSSTGYREVTTYAGATLVDRDARGSNGAAPTGCSQSDLVVGVSDTETTPAHIILMYDNILVRTAP